ncbi:MAG TPA: hypothetical protein VEU08_24185 [Vicinamibacterales bacterium]|nr:hypothetical protein [Vicinamibacterales bacterium]
MQQRQLRLGDILDDYCPRERRVTNHAVVAMVGDDVKQTRCTTCDAEHEYKHAKIPRQRKKSETPAALTSQILAGAPKRVSHDELPPNGSDPHPDDTMELEASVDSLEEPVVGGPEPDGEPESPEAADGDETAQAGDAGNDDGPIHRRLIRASLPRPEGQQPPARPIPEFTIRQPGGRQGRFRPRFGGGQQGRQGQGYQGQGGPFHGNRNNGGRGDTRNGRPQGMNPRGHRHGGPKRSK